MVSLDSYTITQTLQDKETSRRTGPSFFFQEQHFLCWYQRSGYCLGEEKGRITVFCSVLTWSTVQSRKRKNLKETQTRQKKLCDAFPVAYNQ